MFTATPLSPPPPATHHFPDVFSRIAPPPPPVRSLSSTKTPALLPDIAEDAAIPPEPVRTPSPSRRSVRSLSVASFLSEGTVEIEGFGFDNISEVEDVSTIGDDSLYQDSVLGDPPEGEETDLSRRAERILANAKRKLDLCGRNISRVRSSMVLSPSATPVPTPPSSSSLGFSGTGGGTQALDRRSESAEPALHSASWRMGARPAGDSAGGSHLRTSSESAVHAYGSRSRRVADGGAMLPGVVEDPREIERPASEMSRSNSSKSTVQMRALRDQMKDLRGKITSLQQQSKTETHRRTARTAPSSYDSLLSPALQDIRESRELTLDPPILASLEAAQEDRDKYAPIADDDQDDWEDVLPSYFPSSSPEPPPPPPPITANTTTTTTTTTTILKLDTKQQSPQISPISPSTDVNSPFDHRTDAFSFDSILSKHAHPQGHARRASASSNSSTSTVLQPPPPISHPHLPRSDSLVSIASFTTAREPSDTRPPSANPDSPPQQHFLSPATTASPRTDDGYHSAPHTPFADKGHPSPQPPTPTWNSLIMNTVAIQASSARNTPTPSGGVRVGSAGGESTGTGVGAGAGELELRVAKDDRALIEGVVEVLGRVVADMERADPKLRRELRERLQGAMSVLEGEEGEMF